MKGMSMSAADVVQCLKGFFPAPAWAFLEQVADGTGARQHRWADAVAMSVWPSRGYDIHGIEIKVSRYDWLHELRQPKKSTAVQQYCNRWWIATPDDAIIMPGELPPTWGWMVVKGKTMKVVSPAPPLKPKPVSLEFVASILRNVQKADEHAIEVRIRKERHEAHEIGGKYHREKYERLRQQCEEFKAKSGIEITEYSGEDIGEAVETLQRLSGNLARVADAIDACERVKGMLNSVMKLASLKDVVKPKG